MYRIFINHFLILILKFCVATNINANITNSPSKNFTNSRSSHLVSDINSKSTKTEIFHQVLDGSYDTAVCPTGVNGSGPVEVSVNLFVLSVESIDDVKMEYTMQLIYYQQWIDPRVKYDHLEPDVDYLLLTKPERIWVPDVFFVNEKSSSLHELTLPNTYTRIYPDGRIFQSSRMTLILSCPMVLKYYPLDRQSCPLRMESFGWATNDLILKWRPEESVNDNGDPVVDTVREFNMPRFELTSLFTTECNSIFTKTGNFSCIELHLEFGRQFGYYLIQIYVPCIMLVIVSWVAFFLEPTAVEARVSLGVTTILTLKRIIVTQTYGINQSVPPASYVKAIDVWTAVCQAMVFSSILQFSYVNYVARFEWKKEMKAFSSIDSELRALKENALREEAESKAKRVDTISKILFPTLFVTFNFAYWILYTNSPVLNKTQ